MNSAYTDVFCSTKADADSFLEEVMELKFNTE